MSGTEQQEKNETESNKESGQLYQNKGQKKVMGVQKHHRSAHYRWSLVNTRCWGIHAYTISTVLGIGTKNAEDRC